jgi:hypothetical protein
MSKLGGKGVHGFTTTARRAAIKVRTARANASAADRAHPERAQADSVTTLQGICRGARRAENPDSRREWTLARNAGCARVEAADGVTRAPKRGRSGTAAKTHWRSRAPFAAACPAPEVSNFAQIGSYDNATTPHGKK